MQHPIHIVNIFFNDFNAGISFTKTLTRLFVKNHCVCHIYFTGVISNTAAFRSKAMVLLLLTFCLLLLTLWESVIVLCFVVRYFMSILALQSS